MGTADDDNVIATKIRAIDEDGKLETIELEFDKKVKHEEIALGFDETVKHKEFDLEAILSDLGEFGKFQIFIYSLTILPILVISCLGLSYIFTAGQLEYRCKIPECESNPTDYSPKWITNAIPFEDEAPVDNCKRYKYSHHNQSDNLSSFCPAIYFNQSITEKCNEFVYKTDEDTILRAFNLTCDDNEWKLTLIGTLKMSAELIMLPVSGLISDRFGRRTVVICNFALTGVLGVLISFSWNYWMFAILEFLTALVASGSYMTIFILGMELVGRKKRAIGSVIISFVFSMGQVVLGLIAMYVRKFRILQRIIYIPTFLVLSYIWVIPESIRWLLSKGRNREAVHVIQRAAKINGVQLSEKSVNAMQDCTSGAMNAEETGGNFLVIIKSRILSLRLINCCFCWFTNGFVYYGLSVQSVVLGGNKYVNFIMVSVGEIPAVALTYVLLQRVGRRWTLSCSLIVAGIVCLLSELTPNTDSSDIIRLVLFFIGKCSISVSFYVLYVYTTELYPTFLRQSLMGICSAFGFIGSMLAPQTPLLARILPSLTLLLFGSVSILSGVLVTNFPETFNIKLPDTMEEAENIGKSNDATKDN
ncbi:hypothetical protein HA402_011969 [Bradysia odoriphaga]|nr:hypothetical protein HA402_011969 [Bradysia odoriphaga]